MYIMKQKIIRIIFITILLFSTASCQNLKDTIKKIKDAKVEKKPKLQKPDKIVIKVCCD